jgi:predicted nuclease of predicted toxin-antitoxin system
MIWVDAQLSPSLASWIENLFAFPSKAVRDIGLRDAKDEEIFAAGRSADVIILTKDADFAEMLGRLGPPPKVIWLTCGNTSNEALQAVLCSTLPRAVELIEKGEALVEISGKNFR